MGEVFVGRHVPMRCQLLRACHLTMLRIHGKECYDRGLGNLRGLEGPSKVIEHNHFDTLSILFRRLGMPPHVPNCYVTETYAMSFLPESFDGHG